MSPATEGRQSSTLSGKPSATVLVVEDDGTVRYGIRRLLEDEGMPIVVMSGFTAQLMDLRLVSPHVAFLAKPFRNDDLIAAVKSQLSPCR